MILRPFVPSILLLLGAASTARAVDVLGRVAYMDLAKQPLALSLHQLAWQADIQIICDEDCKGVPAPRVVGAQSVQRALDTLLHGSSLHYELLGPHSIGIFAAQGLVPPIKPSSGPTSIPAESDPKVPVQETPAPEILITTGTNFSGGVTAFGPTTTYSHLALEESGAISLGEFLSRLTQNLASNSRSTYGIGAAPNGEHGTSINLRGLGERSTLVLVNGQRIAHSALGDFVDVSLIPLAIIDRVEVLSEGAAAIYGADALAGVVNVVLRKNFSGFETDISNASPAHSGADLFSAAQTAGRDWHNGNIVASLTYHREQRLLSTDRDYSNTPGYTLLPALTDYDGYLSLRQDLAPNVRIDLDSLYSNRHTDEDADYVWSGLRVGPLKQQGVTNQYFVAPTFTLDLDAGWNVIANFDVSQNRFTEMTTYGAGAPAGASDFSTLSESRVRTLDARVDGPLVHLRSGDVRLALGLGERWEDYHSHGSIFEAIAPGSLHRNVVAAYGELYLPLVGARNAVPGLHELDVKLAVRDERYPGAGTTGNPKFDFLWKPVDGLSIRGSYGTSYTVAGYSQTLQAYNAVAIERTASTACASGSCLVAQELGANSTYRPERSKSYSVGADWMPDTPAGVHLRADFYSIHYFDQIAAPPDAATLLANLTTFAGIVVAHPTPAFMSGVYSRAMTYPQGILDLREPGDSGPIDFYLDERTRNFAQTLAMGVDFDLGYELLRDYGVWTADLAGTRVLKLDDRASPGSPDVSAVDTFAHPLSRRYEGTVGLRYSSGILVQLRANYDGSYTNNKVIAAEPIASWVTFDATFIAPLERVFPSLGRQGRLELGIDNLMDREPPYVRTLTVPDGFDPVQANALGRLLKLRFVVRL